jgi:hypothetical protein
MTVHSGCKPSQARWHSMPDQGKIVNELGQILQHFTFADWNNGVLSLSLSELSDGIYFIEIENAGQGAMVRKLVVSHKY